MGELLHNLLERNANKYPADQAIRFPQDDITLNWAETNARANALANYLLAQGVKQGDKVGILIPNRPEFIITFFAILKAGAVVIPINVKLTESEISYILGNAEAKALVTDHQLSTVGRDAAATSGVTLVVETAELEKIYATYSQENPMVPVSILDPAEICYTSGTTGKPKGAVLTHNAVFSVAAMISYEADIKYRDRVLHLMPLTHSAPLNLFMVGATYAGAAHVIGEFTPQNLLNIASQEKTTHFFGAPVAYLLTAKAPNVESYDLSGAKVWIYGGAPMSREGVLLVQQKFRGQLMSVYGLTEAGPNGIALYPEEHPERAGSIGKRPVVNVELKVVDAQGKEVAQGEVGEIALKSPSLMQEYYQNPAATAEVLKDGWLLTGDMASVDADGYIYIKDRKKDIILSGGVNIYPKEIEDVLLQHPQIADAAVVGVPHAEWGETVMAVLVCPNEKPTLEEIQEFCLQKLAKFKIPRLVKYVDALPRNASGKILKGEIIKEVQQING